MKKSKFNNWFTTYWHFIFIYAYTAICLFDFLFAPIAMIIIDGILKLPITPWQPITPSYFHLAAGGIISAIAYTKGQAEVENVKNQPDFSNVPTTKNEDHRCDDPHKEFDGYKRGIPKG
jgi:amino acid transporter